jgi:dolichol kinase
MSLKNKKDLHLSRKIIHMIPAFIFVIMYINFFEYRNIMENYIMKFFIVAIFLDFLRLDNIKLNNIFVKIFSKVMRTEELTKHSGVPPYMTSMTIISAFFPFEVIVLSLLFLSICDPMASLVGVSFRNNEYNIKFKNGKSLFGLMGALLSSFVITLIVGIFVFDWTFSLSFTVGILSGIVVSLSESFPFQGINDNILIPIFSAFFLIILLPILGAI